VARGVSYREEDRDITLARRRERLRTPRIPVNRVLLVLKQIRALLRVEAIAGMAHALLLEALA
jgi:hypothetical protein